MNQKFHITSKIAFTPLAIFNKDFDNLTMTCKSEMFQRKHFALEVDNEREG